VTTDNIGQEIDRTAAALTNQWRPASEVIKVRKRLILAASAHPKTGKTTLALGAPEPIYIANFDDGMEGVADEAIASGKQIYITNYHLPEGATPAIIQAETLPIYAQFMADAKSVLVGKQGTLVIDTHTEQWEMCRFAYFGRIQQVMPYMYGPVNASMRAFVREMYSAGINVIMNRRLSKKYVNDNWNGEYEPRGYNGLEYETQINVKMGRVDPTSDGLTPGYFWLQVVDCRQNSKMNGKIYFDQDIHFKQLMADVFGDLEVDGTRMFIPGQTAATWQEAKAAAAV
jgi:hypothetical protein